MSRILTLAGRRWLAGMSWRSYDKPPTRAVVRTEARALSANAFIQRSGTIRAPMGVEPRYDAGYARVSQGLNRGAVYSLGAALSSAKPGPWIGIFRLSESLFYYIAVDPDGAIIPDQYGELLGSASDIELARAAHESLSEAAVVEGDQAALEQILAAFTGAPPRVRPVAQQISFQLFHLVPALAIVAALVGGVELYLWHQAKVQSELAAAQLVALMHAKPPAPPQTPLEKELTPAVWLLRCNPERLHLSAVENGWDLRQYECMHDSIVLTWARGEGATPTARPAGNLDDSGNVITRVISLDPPSHLQPAAVNNVASLPEARASLQAWAERANLTVVFGNTSAVAGFPLKQCAVKISSPLRPWSLTSLASISGLRLQSMNSTPSGDWILNGVLYGK